MGAVTRRSCLAGAAAFAFGTARASPAAARVVALDWGWAATLVALGVRPVGIAEQRLYHDWVVAPALPDGIPDVGLRTDPSLENLAALQPDLILTNGLNTAIRPKLERIAPTLLNPTYGETKTPLASAKAAARLLGDRLGRASDAAVLVDTIDQRIAAVRDRLQPVVGRAVLPLSLLDRRYATIYGAGSLFGDVLAAVGLRNLWTGPTSLWGHATRPFADLATLPPGDLLVVGPPPAAAAGVLDGPGLLASLCAAAGRQVIRLPPAWGFGDITAAARFADLLADALTSGPPT